MWVETSVVANFPTEPRTASHNKELFGPKMTIVLRLRTPKKKKKKDTEIPFYKTARISWSAFREKIQDH